MTKAEQLAQVLMADSAYVLRWTPKIGLAYARCPHCNEITWVGGRFGRPTTGCWSCKREFILDWSKFDDS